MHRVIQCSAVGRISRVIKGDMFYLQERPKRTIFAVLKVGCGVGKGQQSGADEMCEFLMKI